MDINSAEWIRYLICRSKMWDQMRKNTILKSFPLFCPKCKHEKRNSVLAGCNLSIMICLYVLTSNLKTGSSVALRICCDGIQAGSTL